MRQTIVRHGVKKVKREEKITVRISEEERELLRSYADLKGISLSEAVRELALSQLTPAVVRILEAIRAHGVIKRKMVFHYVNGRVEFSEEPLSTLVQEAIKDREEDVSICKEEPPLGTEYRYFFLFPGFIVEKRVWSPAPPYTWSEESIYIYVL